MSESKCPNCEHPKNPFRALCGPCGLREEQRQRAEAQARLDKVPFLVLCLMVGLLVLRHYAKTLACLCVAWGYYTHANNVDLALVWVMLGVLALPALYGSDASRQDETV